MSIAASIEAEWVREESRREQLRMATDSYCEEPCPGCGRHRLYLTRGGWLHCEKCERDFSAADSAEIITS